MWPDRKQFSQRSFLRTKVSLWSTDCFLNSRQWVNQWSLLHKWRLGVGFARSGPAGEFLLPWKTLLLGRSPWIPKFSPFRGLWFLGSFPLLFRSLVTFPNIGLFKALAFDSENLAMSSNVISLCLLLVMSSATSCHLCLSWKGSLSITLCKLSGFSTLLRQPISFKVFLWEKQKTSVMPGHFCALSEAHL